MDFVRVAEASALACFAVYGKGEKIEADRLATKAAREAFKDVPFSGVIVIGEGEKDKAPGLFHGEKLGSGGVELDIAIDPLEGTTSLAEGRQNSISVFGVSPRGTMMQVPGTYMDVIAVGKKAAKAIDLKAGYTKNLKAIAKALGKDVSEVNVVILDRPRHAKAIEEIRKAGARVKLIDHGTVSATIATAMPNSGIDVLMGDGGAPETIITACALKCLGGNMQARLRPHTKEFEDQARTMGIKDFSKVYGLNDLIKSDDCLFVATGISDGPLVRGIQKIGKTTITNSITLNSINKTTRYIATSHEDD